MERVVNFPRLWEPEFIGDRGKYLRDGEQSFLFSSKLGIWKRLLEISSL